MLKPKAYLFSFPGQNDCFLGFEKSEKEYFQLGAMFLRNFYIGLDYKENSVQIGPTRQDINHAYIDGYAHNPNDKTSLLAIIFVVCFSSILVGLIIWFYMRAKKSDEIRRTVVFA